MDYSCVRLDHNVTRVKYYYVPGKWLHAIGVLGLGLPNIGILAADGLMMASPKHYIHYFDTITEERITAEEAKRRSELISKYERDANSSDQD